MEGVHEPQPVVESLDGTVFLRGETLGLDLRVKGEEMHFVDLATGERLLSDAGEHAARRAAESRATAAESRARAAEAELVALRALLDEKRR